MAYVRSTTSEEWRRERKAAGGRKSRPPRTWGDDDLDTLAQLAGFTVDQQASALKRSASTIDRMRRALRARSVDPS